MSEMFWYLCICALLSCAIADYDNFPVKSVNLDQAWSINFYTLVSSESITVDDAHPVHGIETSDGGVVMVGKGLEAERSSKLEAFAVKVSSTGSLLWSWKSGSAEDDLANSVLQLPNGGDLIVAGLRTVGGVMSRSLTKLSLQTGTEAWSTTDFGDSAGKHGAWETIDATSSKDGVLLGGFTNSNNIAEIGFKSAGNVIAGEAVVMQLPISVLSGPKPSAADVSGAGSGAWRVDFPSFITVKAVRPFGNGDSVGLLYKEALGKAATLVAFTSTGTIRWGPTDFGHIHGEGTDLAVTADGQSFGIVGHGGKSGVGPIQQITGDADCCSISEVLYGRLTVVTADGNFKFAKSYHNGGTKFIKNECWGAQATADGGFAIGCGTGIENCDGMTGQMATECAANKPLLADSRTGAVPRNAAIWQSLVIMTDAKGELKWQRVDSHRDAEQPALGQPGWEQTSSASEWLVKMSDGNLISVNDEGGGAGVMKLVNPGTKTPVLTPSPAPTPSPSPAPPPCPSPTPTPSPSPTPLSLPTPSPQQVASSGCIWTALGITTLTQMGLFQKVGNPTEGDLVADFVFNLPELEGDGKDSLMAGGYIGCPEGGGDSEPMPSPPPATLPKAACTWTALGITALMQFDLMEKAGNPEEGGVVAESVFSLPELEEVGGNVGAAEGGYISCPEDNENREECADDDAGLSKLAGEDASCVEFASECERWPEVKKLCPIACCVESCSEASSHARRLCASAGREIMLFDSALPMDWATLASGEVSVIESVKNGAELSATQAETLKSFGANMFQQVTSNVASKLKIPESELNGLCIYILGDPKRINLALTSTVCDNDGYSEVSSTTTRSISATTDGLGLQGIVHRHFMRLVLNNGTEQDSETNKPNSQLMTEFLAKLETDFTFVFAGAESTSQCLPFKMSVLGSGSTSGGWSKTPPTPTPTALTPTPTPAAPTPASTAAKQENSADEAMSAATLGIATSVFGVIQVLA